MNRRHLFSLLAGAAVAPMVKVPATTADAAAPIGYRIYKGIPIVEAERLPLLEGVSQTVALELFYGAPGVPRRFDGFETSYA